MKKSLLIFTFLLFASNFILAQNSFTSLPGITGGDMSEVQIAESGKLFVANRINNKIYTSDDDGLNWNELNNANNVFAVFTEGSDLYYVTYDQMFKSTDEGGTWELITDGSRFKNPTVVYRLPNTNNTFVIQSDCEGLYVSGDNGVNWSKISKNIGCLGDEFIPAFSSTGDIYFPELNYGILKHTYPEDGVWSSEKSVVIFDKLTDNSDHNLSVGVSTSDNIFITYQNPDDGSRRLAKSVTGDLNSFNEITAPPSPYFGGAIWKRAFSGSLHLISRDDRTFWELTDESLISWSEKAYPGANINTNTFIRFISWKNDTELFASGGSRGIFYSNDNAQTWQFRNGQPPNALEFATSYDIEILGNSNIVIKEAGGDAYGLWVSTDQGASFNWISQDFTIGNCCNKSANDLLKLQDNSLLVKTSEGIQRSTDGINWTIQNIESYGVYTTSGTNEIYSIRKSNPIELVFSTDLGVSWTGTGISGGFPSDFHETYMFSYGDFIYVGIGNRETNQDELWRIDKNTAVATKLLPPNPTNSNGFVLNGKIYISDGKTVSISTNQGNNWTSFEYPHQYMVPIDQKTGGIGLSSNGVLAVTQDDGQTFKNIGIDNPNAVITDLTRNISGVFFASTLRGSGLKFDGELILNDADLPPSINFGWEQMNGPNGGYAFQLLVSPNNQLYATNSEALFLQNNSTSRWERINIPNHFYGYMDFTIDNSNNIYFLDSYQLLTSTDNGTSWDNIGSFGGAKKIRIANNGNIVIATFSNILYAPNLTTPLTEASGLPNADINQLELAGNGTLWASTNNNEISTLFKSNDDGVNWTEISTIDLTGHQIYSINKLPGDAVAIVTNQDIYKSIDDGGSWTSIKSNIPETSTNSYWTQLSKIYIDPNNNLYFYNQDDLYFSDDEGVNWEVLNSNYSGRDLINSIAWYNNQMLIGTSDAGILTSLDGGITFNTFQNNNGFFGKGLSSLLINNGEKFISHGYGEIIRTTDDGSNFTLIDQKIYSDILVKSYDGKLISYGGGISVSVDGGENFEDLTTNLSGGVIGFSRTESENEKYYVVTDEGAIKRFWGSANLSEWTEFTIDGLPNVYNVHGFEVDPSGNIYLNLFDYSDSKFKVYSASFGNANLISQITQPGDNGIIKNDGKVYLRDDGKIFISSDGTNFEEKSTPNGDRFFLTENGYFFVTSENTGDAWISINGGESWQKIPGFAGDRFNDIEIDLFNGYAYAVAENQPLLKSSNIIIPNDNTAPIVNSFSPENNETGIALDFNIELNFNEIVNAVAGKKIRLFEKDNTNTPVEVFNVEDGVFSNNKTTISFIPSIEIEYLTEYFIIIDNGAFLDIFGNAYSGINNETAWTFTTLEQPELSSILSSLSPENNETAVALDFNLILNFNQSISTTTGKKIRLFELENTNTPVEIFSVEDGVLSNSNTTISFTPSTEIEYLTQYYAIIDDRTFLDDVGNSYTGIDNETTWTFTTLEEPDLESPILSFTSPTINKGQTNIFELNVSDDKSIDLNSSKIFYRPISSPATANFSSGSMNALSSSTNTSATFTVTISDNWYDDMGLEYYFEAEDEAGNKVRLPNSSTEYFYSYINFGNAKPDIKGIPFGSSETDYKMISVPHKLVDSQIATQFDELGAHNPDNYRIMTYKGGEEYDEFPDNLKNLGRGIGYWVLLRSYKDIFLENASSPNNNRNELYTIDLKSGWNQIGNPYPVPISWDEIRSENQNVVGSIKRYSNGNYSNGDVLQAYEAGFVFAENNISLPIYFQGGNANARLLENEFTSNLNSDYWELPIKISQGEYANEIGGIGMAIDAHEGKDIYDDYNPPALENSVEIQLKSLSSKNLAKSVVEKQSEYTWEFTPKATGNEPIKLEWGNLELETEDKELILYHINNQKIVDMSLANNYSFNPNENNQFKIFYGENLMDEIKPNKSIFNKAYPNPATTSINFPFTISKEDKNANVVLLLFNNQGQQILEIMNSEFEAGFYSYNWTIENQQLSKGIYFCKSILQNEHGKTIINTQKIIIR